MIITTFLEIADLTELQPPKKNSVDPLGLHLKKVDCPATCAAMYSAVGKSQYWNIYRWGWNERDWQRYLERPGIEIAVVQGKGGSPVGYLEFQIHENASIEILIFGLLPECIGHGLGGCALTLAVKHCLELQPDSVWLHTCSLDHPAALKNYYARGFKFVREERTNYLVLDERPTLLDEQALAAA
jgi:ribosomal protein S18 acetylase RimI-like enzyme